VVSGHWSLVIGNKNGDDLTKLENRYSSATIKWK